MLHNGGQKVMASSKGGSTVSLAQVRYASAHCSVHEFIGCILEWSRSNDQALEGLPMSAKGSQHGGSAARWSCAACVTPSVLHPKSFTKTCHEHHIYVLMNVIECVDKFLET